MNIMTVLQQVRELALNLRTANSGHHWVHADTVSDNILAVLDSTTDTDEQLKETS